MTAEDIASDFLYITKEKTPACYKIYMKYPVEFTEAWVNILLGKCLDTGVESSVDEILQPALFSTIAEACKGDGIATENASCLSGLKAKFGHIRDDHLSKLEQIKLAVAKNNYIAKLAEKNGGDGVSGCQLTTDAIPLAAALEARDLYRESQGTLLNSREAKPGEKACRVRVSMLMQIEEMEK